MSAKVNTRQISKMCACAAWRDPLGAWRDVQARMALSAAVDLERTLSLVAQGNWVAVYRCDVCGTKWAKEFPLSEMHGGGPPCFHAIDTEDPGEWLTAGSGRPTKLRQEAEDRAFFEGLGEERIEPRCPSEGCSRGAIGLSVFCRRHHFERIKGRACVFD